MLAALLSLVSQKDRLSVRSTCVRSHTASHDSDLQLATVIVVYLRRTDHLPHPAEARAEIDPAPNCHLAALAAVPLNTETTFNRRWAKVLGLDLVITLLTRLRQCLGTQSTPLSRCLPSDHPLIRAASRDHEATANQPPISSRSI